MSTSLLVVSIIIFICMIVFNIIGAVWLGLILEHVFLVPAAYIVVLIIVGNINETACLILALIVAAISLIAVIVKPIIAAHNYKKQQEENAQRKKEQEQRNRNLVDAVNRGDKETVQKLIEKSDDANSIDWNNEKHKYLLEIAVENNDKEMVSLLIDKGADVNRGWEKTPLDCAKDEEITSILKSHGAKTQAEINAEKEEMKKEKDKFFWACKYGRLDEVKSLIESGFDLEVRDEDGRTALITAVAAEGYADADRLDEYRDIIKLLIKSGAEIDAKDNEGLTASMHSAMRFGCHLALLIQNGADVNAKDNKGTTVLMYACLFLKHLVEVIVLLISKGADVNARENSNGETPLMYAVAGRNLGAIAALVGNGANVNAEAYNGATALSVAIAKGDVQIKNFLINNGAYR